MAYRITVLEQQIRDAQNTLRDPRSKEILDTIIKKLQDVHQYETAAWDVKWVAVKDVLEYRRKRAEQLGISPINYEKELTFKLAETEKLEYLEEHYPDLVDSFMSDIIGHPEALITDESEIRDFFLYEEAWDEFQNRAVMHGLTRVNRTDSIQKVINDWITLRIVPEKSNIVPFIKADKPS